MKHAFKKIMALLLVVAMIAGVVPSVFAAGYVEPFRDVKEDDWFAEYVKYVYKHDPQLMDGMTPITFEPDKNCTRAMTAVVLYRLADPVVPAVNESKFVDLTADWYKNAVAWAEENEVVNGVDKYHFNPDGLVTREQLVTMMWRFYGEPETDRDYLKDFTDAKQVSAYAKEAFNWAIGKGIIGGRKITENNKTRVELVPQGYATRAEMAKILTTAIKSMEPCPEDGHSWDDGVVNEKPTCESAGEMLYTCTQCGQTKLEVIPALGHNFVDGVCTVCGTKIAEDDEIVIYYTNDVHTYIDGVLSYDTIADMKYQTQKVAAGTLLVDAGDHIQGTAYGSMDKGKSIIELMNAAGYDLATLGNHEFDYGMEGAMNVIRWAQFPYVSANFYHESNGVKGANVLESYKIFEISGKKIAFVGITTPESFTKSTPAYFQDEAGNYIYGIAGGVTGADLYASVQSAINAAKAAGADYIIALGHLGDDVSSKPWTSEDLIANTTGLNAFIDGHSHSTVEMKTLQDAGKNKVVLTQTGSYFGAIGKMTIDLGRDTLTTELITSFNGSNAAVASLKNEWMNTVDGMLGTVIGHTSLTFDNYKDGQRLVRKQETNTGDFAADALYYLFDNMGLDVDVAIMNGGGVRNKAITGDISYKTCKDIHTFGNVACLQTVTGQQILDALEWGARDTTAAECGGFLQVSGLTYDIYTNIKSTVRKDDKGVWTGGPTGDYRVNNVKIWDKDAGKYVPLDKKASYNLAGYNYTLRDLGDGFAMFKGAVNVLDYVMEDYMVLANYIESFAVVNGKHEIVANSPSVPFGSDYSTVDGSGRIKIITNGQPVDEENIFTLATSIADGDEVVIYNPGHKMAIKNETDRDWYLIPQPTEPTGTQFIDPSEDLVWKVRVNSDGTVNFTNGGNQIMCWVSGNYFELTNNAGYEGADGNWKVTFVNGLGYINHATFAGSYGPAYIECFYNANKDVTNISGYSTNDPTTKSNDFGFQFFVKGAGGVNPTEPTTGPIEPTTAPSGDYALASSIKNGDQVIIYNPGNGKAVTNEMSGYYVAGADVTPANNIIASPIASTVWTVTVNADGTYTFKNGSTELGADSSENNGKTYNNLYVEAGHKNTWKLETCNAANNTFVVYNAQMTANYGHIYLEWYAAKSGFSAYDTSADKATEQNFGFQFYVKGASVTPTTPTTAPTEPTTGPIEPTTAPSGDYALASSIKGGDQVIIYNPGHGMAIKNETDRNWYLVPQAITPASGKITSPDASLVWTVVDNGNGTYSFTNGSNKIVMWVSGNYFELTNDAAYSGANGNWKVTWKDGLAYIQHESFSNSYGPAYIECFTNSSGTTNVSGYSTSDPTSKSTDYGWQFYVKGGSVTPTTPTTAPTEPTTGPIEPTTAPGGDYVAIYYPKDSKVMTTESYLYNNKKYEMVAADATLSGGKLTTSATNVALFQMITANGVTTFKTADGKYLEADGTNVQLVSAESENTKFILEANGSDYFIKCATATYNNNPQYIEFYGGYFTVYSKAATADASIYTFNFYPVGGGTTPTEPTTGPIEPTTAPGGDSFVVADSIAVGDKIVFVAAYNGTNYAMTNSTAINNALGAAEVTVSGDTVDVALKRTLGSEAVWEVCAGTEAGKYTLKSSDGKYISYGETGTMLKLADAGSNFTVKTGKGVSQLAGVDSNDADRVISFRNNAGAPQFRLYKTANNSGEYSQELTIYKLGGSTTPTEPTTAPTEPTSGPTEPTTAPSGNEYVLTTSLKDGDQVIIYNASAKKAMSEDAVSTNYRAGADVTVSGNKIVTDDSKIVWTVKASGSGFTFTNDAGETLSATKGLSFATTDNVWAINPATTANSVYIVSTTAAGSQGDPKYVEWYAQYSEFSTYYYSAASEAIFAMQLFAKSSGTVTPTEPTTAPTEPTTAPTEPTTAPTEPTTAPTEPTTAPTEPTSAPTQPTTAPTEPTEPVTEYKVTVKSDNEEHGRVTIMDNVVTATPDNGYYACGFLLEPADAATVLQSGNYFYLSNITKDCVLTVQFREKDRAEIRFSVPAGCSAKRITTWIDEPTALKAPEGKVKADMHEYVFLGWSETTVKDEKEKPVYFTDIYTPEKALTTLYALYTYEYRGETFYTTALQMKTCLAKEFNDVDVKEWYHDALDFVLEYGYMNGVDVFKFDPNGKLTRGMMVTILYRLEEREGKFTHPFTDVKMDAWYAEAVAWAYENGVVNGTSTTTFSPNEPITREQTAAMLYRYAKWSGEDVTPKGSLMNFVDADKVSAYARDPMRWAVGEGIINGKGKIAEKPTGTDKNEPTDILDPLGTATRAEIAQILYGWLS
ncbi:MAG: S-layer homology domain-containing protein [Oscillospiraceae bacterium]|nr:S-layer homology domain-containing protein [Oscillospiraceae bacterium]